MSLWKAVKGFVVGEVEKIEDANGVLILTQEIRDAETALGNAKAELATLMGAVSITERKVNDLKSKINDYEEKGSRLEETDPLLNEVIEKIAVMDAELAPLKATYQNQKASVEKLRDVVSTTERSLKDKKSQIESLKATEAVQKAQKAIHGSVKDVVSGGNSVQARLDRVKAHQEAEAAKMAAAEILVGDNDFDRRLNAATSSTESIKDRLKKRK